MNGKSPLQRTAILAILFLTIFLFANQAAAMPQAEYTITVTLDEAWSKTNADGAGSDDIYWRVHMKPLAGEGGPVICGNEDMAQSGAPHIKPGWTCAMKISGNEHAEAEIRIELWESDSWFTGSDDHFDIHPAADKQDLELIYKPHNNLLSIEDIKGWEAPGRCAMGGILQEGKNGDDQGMIRFTVGSDLYGGATADIDEDGLLNSWELCGVNTDSDNEVEVDLPGMGADPLHKDLFIEIDWMMDDNGGANDHSHEPWLPSLMNAWHEFDQAHVTNPDGRAGVKLHLDVGDLYEGYAMDFNGDGANEIDVGATGVDVDGDGAKESLHMDNDGIADIGYLAKLGAGSVGGGNRVPGNEDTVLDPHATNGLCGSGSDLLYLRASQFNADRQETFRWALFGHQHSSNTSSSSGVSCWGGETFAVTLASWGRETGLTGPSGLPVDGLIENHTGTFMHELGHSLSIGHGGKDSVNYKPNYLSLMSYHFQMNGIRYSFDGDLLADAIVGQDFDHDGQDDIQRYLFSQQKLPTLDENSLTESAGIGDSNILTRVGPAALDTNGDSVCDKYCTQNFEWALGDQAIDFSRGDHDNDGTADNDTKINSLTAPPNPANTPTDLNRDDALSKLDGSNDSDQLQNGSLAVGGAGLSNSSGANHSEVTAPQVEFLELHTSGVTPIANEAFIERRCARADLYQIDFDDLAAGAVVANQYAPLATFSSTAGTPLIADSAYRNGHPTQSPPHSLVNDYAGPTPGPLLISFGEPQRLVGLYLGRREPSGAGTDYAQLTAYDIDGQIIGSVTRPLPGPSAGITAFLGAGAVFEDRLIARVEVQNIGRAAFEAAHIDDLVFCQDKKEDATPRFPAPPSYGERVLTIGVEASVVTVGPANSEHAEPLVHTPLTHVPVAVDGKTDLTGFSFTRGEGEMVTLDAPAAYDLAGKPLEFLHWVMDDKIIFPDKQHTISALLMRDATLKAVYRTTGEGCYFVVNSTADANDIDVGDGVCLAGRASCTLRAAVEEANAQRGACLITVPAGTYNLTIGGLNEDQALTGDLDITGRLAILGAGDKETIVDGKHLDTLFHVHEDANAAVLGMTLTGGGFAGYPGAVVNEGALQVGACRLWNNGSPVWLGGAVLNLGDLSLIKCEVAYNEAHSGGGIFNYGMLNVLRSTFHHNETRVGDGGAIVNYKPGEARVEESAIFLNATVRHGGGVWNGSQMAITNSTVSENQAVSAGGLANEGTLALNNVTVAGNRAPSNLAGGLRNFAGTTSAANSLFAGNVDEGQSAPDCMGILQSAGHNLIENPQGCVIQGYTPGNILGAPAMIGPLAYAGGGTTAGHELLAGSPARDAGSAAAPGSGSMACAISDQIGVTRPQNGRCDMGALEMLGKGEEKEPLQPPEPVVPKYRLYLPSVRG